MNRDEAIEVLEPFKACMYDQHGCPISDVAIALDVAIEALKEPERKIMTVDELKRTANEIGYSIIKKPEYIKFLPCKCGCNKRERWYGVKKDDAYIYICKGCGARAEGRTEREAKRNWNKMMEGEK